MLEALASLGTFTTFATLTTLRAFPAFTALGAWTALTLYIAFGLFEQDAAAQLELAGLRVNLQELHLQLVAFLES